MRKQKSFLSRRGIGLGDVPELMLTLVFIVTIGVASYLVLAGLNSGTTDAKAKLAIGNFTVSMDNVVSYAPTWGVIIGVAVLIGIVLSAFYFGKKLTGGGGL